MEQKRWFLQHHSDCGIAIFIDLVTIPAPSVQLGYKHHELVASLPRTAQQELLREAEQRRLSSREFQIRISEYKKLVFCTGNAAGDLQRPLG
jgi:hypothetical protein